MTDTRYPFAAIVGQERVKKALIYNLIEPRIGGALLCGEKGTAKSTIVRGLAALTDQQVVDLPLNITEDMLVGSIDFERAVHQGVRAFAGGVLERADGNILYVDEVNLLPDGVVSTLICAAVSGENIVEREGISWRHPCRFALVGTMNPEEGKLRPQFLDRFGLYVDVAGEKDVEVRAEIIRRRMEYEADPAGFCRSWASQTEVMRKRIVRARKLVEDIPADEGICRMAARYALQAGAEGNRCELVLVRTAAAVAAWDGRDYISAEDLKEAAEYVLPHRRRESAPPETGDNQDDDNRNNDGKEKPEDQTDRTEEENADDGDRNEEKEDQEDSRNQEDRQEDGGQPDEPSRLEEQEGNGGEETDIAPPTAGQETAPEEDLVEGEEVQLISALPSVPRDRMFRQGSGRRSRTKSGTNKGRYAGFTPEKRPGQTDIALDATLRAAAPYQSKRDHTECAVALCDSDLRYKVRESHVGATIVFVVDASGSMGAQKRMKATKEAILSMLLDSYQKRDRIGMVAFRKNEALTLLDITASVDLAEKKLQALPTGGRTPLAAGLYRAWQLLKARRLKDPELLPMLVLVTDGRANQALWSDDPVEDAMKAAQLIRQDHIHSVVIDTEKDFISLEIAKQVAGELDAAYFKVDELRGDQLRTIVRSRSGLAGERD